MSSPKRGEIFWVDWSPGRGSEQLGVRPSLVISANPANLNPRNPNVIVACLTTKGHDEIATQVPVTPSDQNGLRQKSWVKCEQIFTVSKGRLQGRLGELNPATIATVDATLKKMLALA